MSIVDHNDASVFCSEPQFSFPTERVFTRRAGPPATAWPQRHAEEEFLALVRHNAATKLEMEHWPSVLNDALGSQVWTTRIHGHCVSGQPRTALSGEATCLKLSNG